MEAKSTASFYTKGLIVAIITILLFTIFPLVIPSIFSANAQAANPTPNPNPQRAASPEERQALITALSGENSCPDPIKKRYLDLLSNPASEVYLSGTFIVTTSADGKNPVALTCANANSLEKILVRGIMVIYSLLGLFLAFSIIRAGVLMITSFANSEQFQTALKSLIMSIIYTVGALFSYTIFVFVAVGIFGIGVNAQQPEYNLFCQNRIIFNLTLDQAEAC